MKFDFFDYELLDYLEEEKERRKETAQAIVIWCFIVGVLIFSGILFYQSYKQDNIEIIREVVVK